MYTCVTNDEANTRMVSGLSKYLEGELRFNKLFAVWVKMINKNHYAYLGGISIVDKIGKCITITYRIYYTNGASSYYMQVKKISNFVHDILQFEIKEVDQVPFKELEFFTSPSYRCLELFAAHFLFPILGIFEAQKEENIEKVIDEYVTKLESMELTYFNFGAEDQEQEILNYLNRPNDKITRVGSFQYQDNDILREINFLQFLSSEEYVYFVQQKIR